MNQTDTDIPKSVLPMQRSFFPGEMLFVQLTMGVFGWYNRRQRSQHSDILLWSICGVGGTKGIPKHFLCICTEMANRLSLKRHLNRMPFPKIFDTQAALSLTVDSRQLTISVDEMASRYMQLYSHKNGTPKLPNV